MGPAQLPVTKGRGGTRPRSPGFRSLRPHTPRPRLTIGGFAGAMTKLWETTPAPFPEPVAADPRLAVRRLQEAQENDLLAPLGDCPFR